MARLSRKKHLKSYKITISLYALTAFLFLICFCMYTYKELSVISNIYAIVITLFAIPMYLYIVANKKRFRK